MLTLTARIRHTNKILHTATYSLSKIAQNAIAAKKPPKATKLALLFQHEYQTGKYHSHLHLQRKTHPEHRDVLELSGQTHDLINMYSMADNIVAQNQTTRATR